ncbi:MAG: thymidine phosphorylase, partial [Armatimonadota bacterium]|nr:thymidine phosphorylase [Armatimonadota bacterium]
MALREVIARKRDGLELSAEEIRGVVDAYVSGQMPDSQMAALLMAVVLRGMTARETTDLTLAMVESGQRLDLSAIPGTKVDKHSTGGVGDKTTLVVAPLVAALGVPVPKMSGRALGHTGGTIDKLECIPGLTTDLSPERFCRQVAEIGLAIAAQSDEMVPADKKIYVLRDATATVESVPLIASSVMSKKLAVGADAIVLDVKAGRGAFMPDVEGARALAQAMVDIGARAGKRAVALVTRMDEPLGTAVGDGPELVEAIATLAGRGPADFVELCEIVAGHMLSLAGAASDPDDGRKRAQRGLASGMGLTKLREMIVAQGGRGDVLDDPEVLPGNPERITVSAERDGYVAGIDARRIGLLVRDLKVRAGERKAECGVLLHKKSGDLTAGEPVATVL